jgi:hypothetical protein
MFPYAGQPLGVQVGLSVSGTAIAPTVPAGAQFALISVETEAVRYRDDGTPPTASNGVLIPVTTATEPWVYYATAGFANLEFIATSGTAILNIAYYK